MAGIHGGDVYRNKIEYDFSVSINPLGCPKEITEALKNAAEKVMQYPDPLQEQVRKALAEYLNSATGVRPEVKSGTEVQVSHETETIPNVTSENIICGNGASELFTAIVNAVRPRKALLIEPTFAGYEHALANRVDIRRHYLTEENGFALSATVLNDITDDVDLVFLCSPNTPTGRLVDPELIRKILNRCRECGAYLVLDECFMELSTGSDAGAPLIAPNLIIVKAFTKLFAIPGVRFGYAIAQPQTIEAIKAQLPEWNISVFAEAAAQEGCRLLTTDFLKATRDTITEERAYLAKELSALGYTVFPSDANYLLFRTQKESGGASTLYDALLSRGILIRDCNNFRGLYKGHYRIAVLGHKSNEILITNLNEVINGT